MGMSRKQYLTMPQSQEENQSFRELLWTLIMQMIKSDEDLKQDSASSSCIIWYTRQQATVGSAVFGAEFVAMKQAMEVSRGLRYKLRMMRVPIEGPTHMYGDNMSTIHNTQHPESQLKKKSNSICYHAVREAVAMGELLTGHVKTDETPVDTLTKIVSGGIKRKNMVQMCLYDIHDGW